MSRGKHARRVGRRMLKNQSKTARRQIMRIFRKKRRSK